MDKNKLHSVFHLESCICLDYSIRYFSVSYYFHLWLSFTIDYVDNIHGFYIFIFGYNKDELTVELFVDLIFYCNISQF